jgi:hypothetical protein
MSKVEKFMKTKKYLTKECIDVAKKGMENNWAINKVSTYIMEEYKGIDQYIVLHTVMNHHWKNENREEIVNEMDEHFWKTIERWVNPTINRDEEKFLISATNSVFAIPTKY